MIQKFFSLNTLINFLIAALKIAITFGVGAIVYLFSKQIIQRIIHPKGLEEKGPPSKSATTVATLLQNILKYFILILCVIISLGFAGVNYASLLVGVSIGGFVIGIGMQSVIRDIVSGFFIIFERQYEIGDFIELKAPFEIAGVVEAFGLRTTKIKSLDGEISYIPNGSIVVVSKYPKGFTSFFLDLVIPSSLERKDVVVFLLKATENFFKQSKFLVKPPRIIHETSLLYVESNMRIELFCFPFKEDIAIEQLSSYLKQEFKLKFREDLCIAATYKLDEKSLRDYRDSLARGAEKKTSGIKKIYQFVPSVKERRASKEGKESTSEKNNISGGR